MEIGILQIYDLLCGCKSFSTAYDELELDMLGDKKTALWDDQVVVEAFKADVGDIAPVTLHSAQSRVLKRLLLGENIAVRAPTSIGKSFIIDAFISI